MENMICHLSPVCPHTPASPTNVRALLISVSVTPWKKRFQLRRWHFLSFQPPFGYDPLALGKEIRFYISYQPPVLSDSAFLNQSLSARI